jgi:hypothetical protein
MKPIEFEDGNILLCGNCGQNFVNHTKVVVYSRYEDAERTLVTEAGGVAVTTSSVGNKTSGNPSSRRHGIAIEFECEYCRATPRLTIAQHKGQTVAQWD